MTQSGTISAKSYRSFAVSDGLLAKVVAAVKQGEADARRTGQVRSFEVFMHGHRQNMVIGRLMVVPPKVADSLEDFPASLLYGAMVKEISPEATADLLHHKIGESEFDDYKASDLSHIKDRLFKDFQGKFRCLVLFIPAWTTPREYVTFKFEPDEVKLGEMVRHLVFAAYYDPRFSSAFNQMEQDADSAKTDVTDITPKMIFPFLAENVLKQYPELDKPELGDVKVASARLPKMVLAADTANEFVSELLDPGEKAVLNELGDDLKAKVEGEVEKPGEVVGEASFKSAAKPVVKAPSKKAGISDNPLLQAVAERLQAYGLDAAEHHSGGNVFGILIQLPDGGSIFWGIADGGWSADVSSATDTVKSIDIPVDETCDDVDKIAREIFRASVRNGAMQKAASIAEFFDTCPKCKQQNRRWKPMSKKQWDGQGKGPSKEEMTRKCEHCEHEYPHRYAKAAAAIKPTDPGFVLEKDGAKLMEVDHPREKGTTQFVAVAPNGANDYPVFDGSRVVYHKPDDFPPSFRIAVEQYLKQRKVAARRLSTGASPRTAGVPLTFEQIWNDVTSDLGPAPEVVVPKVPKGPSIDTGGEAKGVSEPAADKPAAEKAPEPKKPTDPAPAPAKAKSDLERMHERRGEDADGKPNQPPYKTEEKKEAPKETPKALAKAEAKPEVSGKPEAKKEAPKPEAKKPEVSGKPEEKKEAPKTPAKVEEKKEEPKPEEKKEASKKAFTAPGETCKNCGEELDAWGSCPRLSAKDASTCSREGNKRYCTKPKPGTPDIHLWPGKAACVACTKPLGKDGVNEIGPDKYAHVACIQKVKKARLDWIIPGQVLAAHYPALLAKFAKDEAEGHLTLDESERLRSKGRFAAFDMFIPGKVLSEFDPGLQHDIVDYPTEGYDPLIQDVDIDPNASGGYIPTSPAPAMGIGNQGKPEVLEGAPLHKEQDIRGPMFQDEFNAQYTGLPVGALRAMGSLSKATKTAGKTENKAQFTDFLKKVVGEIAATFLTAFKVTNRPLMDSVPGIGEVQLSNVEQSAAAALNSTFNIINTGSRVKFLLSQLNDGDIKEAINEAWAQAAVWSDSPNGGFNYEIFVRAETIDTDTMILKYKFVTGTKGL